MFVGEFCKNSKKYSLAVDSDGLMIKFAEILLHLFHSLENIFYRIDNAIDKID